MAFDHLKTFYPAADDELYIKVCRVSITKGIPHYTAVTVYNQEIRIGTRIACVAEAWGAGGDRLIRTVADLGTDTRYHTVPALVRITYSDGRPFQHCPYICIYLPDECIKNTADDITEDVEFPEEDDLPKRQGWRRWFCI